MLSEWFKTVKMWKCLLLSVTQILLLGFVSSQPCSKLESLNITDGIRYDNGSISHNGIEYSSSEWYDTEEDGNLTVYGCPCIKRSCLWKCCGEGQAFFNKTCETTAIEEVNPFYAPVYKGKELTGVLSDQIFFYMYNTLCDERYLVDSRVSGEEIYVQENGTLNEVSLGGSQWHKPTTFCVDMLLSDVTQPPRFVAAVCYPEESASSDSEVLYIAYAVGIILSVPFLLSTILVYALIPELRNLHGLCLMAYCSGLLVAYPVLAYLKLNTGEVGVAMTGCILIAFIVYYAFQTSFFWLNVMCFDIWRTFSGYRGGGTSKQRERKRFLMYGAYAWGVPLALTAVTAAMQFSAGLPSSVVRPNFGLRKCWFEGWQSEMAYFFSPVLVLVVCNVTLFVITANRIRSIRQETAILKSAESSRSDKMRRDKQRYALYLKLFVVMGVNWTIELIGFAVGGSNWYWIIIDISNVMLGFFIFLIFVWKNKVRNLVVKRWRSFRGVPQTAADSSGTGKWATRSSSAPTEDTRVSAIEDSAMRLKDMH